MALRPEIAAFIQERTAMFALEDNLVTRLPKLDDISDDTTIDSLKNGSFWPVIRTKLRDNGLNDKEIQAVHQTLIDVSELKKGETSQHMTIGVIRSLSKDELLMLSHYGAKIDSHAADILIGLFGVKTEVNPE